MHQAAASTPHPRINIRTRLAGAAPHPRRTTGLAGVQPPKLRDGCAAAEDAPALPLKMLPTARRRGINLRGCSPKGPRRQGHQPRRRRRSRAPDAAPRRRVPSFPCPSTDVCPAVPHQVRALTEGLQAPVALQSKGLSLQCTRKVLVQVGALSEGLPAQGESKGLSPAVVPQPPGYCYSCTFR